MSIRKKIKGALEKREKFANKHGDTLDWLRSGSAEAANNLLGNNLFSTSVRKSKKRNYKRLVYLPMNERGNSYKTIHHIHETRHTIAKTKKRRRKKSNNNMFGSSPPSFF